MLETIHCCDFFKEESNQIKFMTQQDMLKPEPK